MISNERCTGAFMMGPTIDQILELNAAGRLRTAAPTTSRRCGPSPGKPEWNEMVTMDDSPWATTRPASARPRSWEC